MIGQFIFVGQSEARVWPILCGWEGMVRFGGNASRCVWHSWLDVTFVWTYFCLLGKFVLRIEKITFENFWREEVRRAIPNWLLHIFVVHEILPFGLFVETTLEIELSCWWGDGKVSVWGHLLVKSRDRRGHRLGEVIIGLHSVILLFSRTSSSGLEDFPEGDGWDSNTRGTCRVHCARWAITVTFVRGG